MTSSLRYRLSLAVRMGIALFLVGSVSVTVVVSAVLVTGLFVFLGVLAVTFVLTLLMGPVVQETPIVQVWTLSRGEILTVMLVSGLLLSPVLYLKPVREEIQAFRQELGTTGELAVDRHPKIAGMARQLAQQADIPAPEVRIVNRSRPESYALDDAEGGTVVITRGVIRQLDDDEITAVLAHEVSHLANRDGTLLQWLLVPMLVAEHVGYDDRPALTSAHLLTGIGYLAHLFVWAVITVVMRVQLLACQFGVAVLSRGREFAADRAAAELTGAPSAVASALEKLDETRSRPTEDKRDFRRTTGVLDILPVENLQHVEGPFRTHPRTETRIARLQSLVENIEI